MANLFGTDGIRGRFGEPPLDPTSLSSLGHAAALFLRAQGAAGPIVIARDTRASGPEIQDLLTTIFRASGFDVIDLGITPTPALVLGTTRYKGCLGIMISASHNPWHDNGLKFFDARGVKLSQDQITHIESFLGQSCPKAPSPGTLRAENIHDVYANFVLSTLGAAPLDGLHIALDTAHGAFSEVAEVVLRKAGTRVTVLYNAPNGQNINDQCGTTYPQTLKEATVKHNADFGIAFDGDGDRVLISLKNGTLLNGDQILAFLALDAHAKEQLTPPVVVSTTMANQAMEDLLTQKGIRLIRTPVGDRFVAKIMDESGALLGGEASGHLILKRHSTTGDGLLSALHVLGILKKQTAPTRAFTPYPHHIENIPLEDVCKNILDNIDAAQNNLSTALAKGERLLLRLSGTEPLLRLMIEAPSQDKITQLRSQALAKLVSQDASC